MLIEERLEGREISVFAFVDGLHVSSLVAACDYKRVGDGDIGPNTGGMGAYSPAPVLTPALEAEAIETIIKPTIAGMAKAGTPYSGVLYAGLMLTDTGPQLIEYNVRFGDPECQVLMPRLQSDLIELMLASIEGSLVEHEADWTDEFALSVVLAAQGYPGAYEKGTEIGGLAGAVRNHLRLLGKPEP